MFFILHEKEDENTWSIGSKNNYLFKSNANYPRENVLPVSIINFWLIQDFLNEGSKHQTVPDPKWNLQHCPWNVTHKTRPYADWTSCILIQFLAVSRFHFHLSHNSFLYWTLVFFVQRAWPKSNPLLSTIVTTVMKNFLAFRYFFLQIYSRSRHNQRK